MALQVGLGEVVEECTLVIIYLFGKVGAHANYMLDLYCPYQGRYILKQNDVLERVASLCISMADQYV